MNEADQIERFGESLESKVAMTLAGRLAFLEVAVGLQLGRNDPVLREELERLSIPNDVMPSTQALRSFVEAGWDDARRRVLGDRISNHDLPPNE